MNFKGADSYSKVENGSISAVLPPVTASLSMVSVYSADISFRSSSETSMGMITSKSVG